MQASQKSAREAIGAFLQNRLQSHLAAGLSSTIFGDFVVSSIFKEYNTAMPISASVKRIFVIGKDVLKPKQAGLSDSHFEIVVFLKVAIKTPAHSTTSFPQCCYVVLSIERKSLSCHNPNSKPDPNRNHNLQTIKGK